MARRTRTIETEEDAPLTQVEAAELDREQFELGAFLEEFGDTVNSVGIHRITDKGLTRYVDTRGTDGLTHEALREAYGGPATYELRFRGAGGRYIRKARVHIDALKVGDAVTKDATGAVVAAPANDRLLEFMQAQLLANQQQFNTLLAGILSKPAPAAPDPAAMLLAVSQVWQGLQGNKGADPLDQISKVAGLIRDLSGNGGGDGSEDNMWTVVKEVGGRVVEIARPLIEQGASGLAKPPIAATVTPVNTVTPKPAGALPAAEDPMLNLRKWVEAGLVYLKKKAAQQKDVELQVDYVIDNTDEPMFGALIQAMNQGVTFEQVLQFDPEIANNPLLRSWFERFYNELSTAIADSAGDAPVDTKRPAGNAGHATGDADSDISKRQQPDGSGTGGTDRRSGQD